jgi:CheY-like chemotaxis protein
LPRRTLALSAKDGRCAYGADGTSAGTTRCARMGEPTFTILFAEDDAAVRESTAAILAARGFRLLVAKDGAEALRLLSKNPVDVLFTDVVMPDLNGIELAREAQRLRPNIKVLLMTAYYSRASEAERVGTLLFKPLRGAELEAELGKLLAA